MAIHSVTLTNGTEFYVEAAPEATQNELLQLLRQGKGMELSSKLPKKESKPTVEEPTETEPASPARQEQQRIYEQMLAEAQAPVPVPEIPSRPLPMR